MNKQIRQSIVSAAAQGAEAARAKTNGEEISSPREEIRGIVNGYARLIAATLIGEEISRDELDRLPTTLRNQCRWQAEQLYQDIQAKRIDWNFASKFLHQQILETKAYPQRMITPGSIMAKMGADWTKRVRAQAQGDSLSQARVQSKRYLAPYTDD